MNGFYMALHLDLRAGFPESAGEILRKNIAPQPSTRHRRGAGRVTFEVVHSSVSRIRPFGNRRHHRIGTARDVYRRNFSKVTLVARKALSRSGAIIYPCEVSSRCVFASHSMLCGRKPKRHHHRQPEPMLRTGDDLRPADDAGGGSPFQCARIFTPLTLPLAWL